MRVHVIGVAFALAVLALSAFPARADLDRPVMMVERGERAEILARIAKYPVLQQGYNTFKAGVNEQIAGYGENPAVVLDTIPAFGGNRHGHLRVLHLAGDCGSLYFLTGDERYAQVAADVLHAYAEGVLQMDPDKIQICAGDFFMDSRTSWRSFGVIYDFVAPFVKTAGTMVYDRTTKSAVPYNNEAVQMAFERMARFGLHEWAADSNHPLLEGGGLLQAILAIENDAVRDALVDEFVKGNKATRNGPDAFFADREGSAADAKRDGAKMGNGVLWARDTCLANDGHWPETPTYGGFAPGIIGWMDVLDRLYPHYKLFEGTELMFEALPSKKLFTYPNGTEAVAFGDSRRVKAGVGRFHGGGYQGLIRTAQRVGFNKIAQNMKELCKGDLEHYLGSVEAYVPDSAGAIFDYLPLDDVKGRFEDFQTAEFPYAGVVIQKNVNVEDPKTYGLMCYAGGAHYVHNHLSGLDLELYGPGLVMGATAADGGIPGGRGSDINRNYYRIYAGHNTVVVNGASKGGKKSWKSDGMLYMDTTRTEAMEPAHQTEAISKAFTFSSQRLNDTVNHCDQQRIVSIVRTGDESGYYFDLFRSVSEVHNMFADYIYHNVGDQFTLAGTNGAPLALHAEADRYRSYAARGIHAWNGPYEVFHPGWHYFKDVTVSAPVATAVRGTFTLAGKGKYMHVAMPGGIEREYTACQAPPILETAEGYAKKSARVMVVRQTEECWKRPFIAVYEPSTRAESTVQSVENIIDGERIVGAKVVSKVGDVTVTDLILAQDEADRVYENTEAALTFRGRFAVIRTRESAAGSALTLYIGDGDEVSYGAHLLKATDGKGIKTVDLDTPLPAFVNKESDVYATFGEKCSQ